MIMYSTRARIVGFAPDAVAWGTEIGSYVTKTLNVPVEVGSRIGGHQDMVWVSRYDDMGELEADLGRIQQDAGYQSRLKKAVEAGWYDPASIETAIWRIA